MPMFAWLALESGMIADAEAVEQALAAIPSVIWNTSFGHILAAQTLALLVLSLADARQHLGSRPTELQTTVHARTSADLS
jgi:hypothetical protein